MSSSPQSESMVKTESEIDRRTLRRRWELASVLNFFQVFEPVVLKSKMKISAEEIEAALINPNGLLSQLHIILLKEIPPVSKNLNGLDAWVTALCKKLATWWPWVAEGEIPLTVDKGKEIHRYKELDPTTRLLLLKALCEIRAEQHDIVSHINDALKNKIEVSSFRKDMIGGDGTRVAYWLDGSAVNGYRLYKEVKKLESKPISKGKESLPSTISDWNTLATNFDEFRKLVDDFSSSGSKVEVAVGKAIETDVIPILNKLQMKKEKALKQQQRQEMLINGFRNCGIARSCRSCTPVTYTFDAYDKAIDEAIQVTKKRKNPKEHRIGKKQGNYGEINQIDSNELSGSEIDSEKSSVDTQESTETDSERELRDSHVESENDSEEDDAYKEEDSNSSGSEIAKKEIGNKKQVTKNQKQIHRHFGSRWSNRLAGNANHSALENKAIVAKNRSRQRPTCNSAIESTVISDSEDEQSSDDRQRSTCNSALKSTVISDSEGEQSSDDGSSHTSGSNESQ